MIYYCSYMPCFYVLLLKETSCGQSFLLHFRFTSLQISAKDVSGLVMGQRMEFLKYLFQSNFE